MVNTKTKQTRAAATRDKILRAASQVVMGQGIDSLTLDAVAKQAEISKGGLLYHFPNKNVLIVGLGDQLLSDFGVALQQEFEQDEAPGTPGQWLRAYVRSTDKMSQESLALFARLSSKLVEMPPELLQSVKAFEQQLYERLETDGLDPVQATIIQLAIDGLWFSEAFQMVVPNQERRSQVVKALLEMTKVSP